jgi:hypothetical protein
MYVVEEDIPRGISGRDVAEVFKNLKQTFHLNEDPLSGIENPQNGEHMLHSYDSFMRFSWAIQPGTFRQNRRFLRD